MEEFYNMWREDCGLKRRPITTRNPQSNAIIEYIHQTIVNIIRTFNVKMINNDDPRPGIFSATIFGVHVEIEGKPLCQYRGTGREVFLLYHQSVRHITPFSEPLECSSYLEATQL